MQGRGPTKSVAGERCWYWREKPRGKASAVERNKYQGRLYGPATVLYQQRRVDPDRGINKRHGIVWVVDGDRLIRCSPAHLRVMEGCEKMLEAVRDTERQAFAKAYRMLGDGTFEDLTETPEPPGQSFEDPVVEPTTAGGDEYFAPCNPEVG